MLESTAAMKLVTAGDEYGSYRLVRVVRRCYNCYKNYDPAQQCNEFTWHFKKMQSSVN